MFDLYLIDFFNDFNIYIFYFIVFQYIFYSFVFKLLLFNYLKKPFELINLTIKPVRNNSI